MKRNLIGSQKVFRCIRTKKRNVESARLRPEKEKRNLLVVPHVIGIQRKANKFGKMFGNSFGNNFGNKFGTSFGNNFGSIEKPGLKMCFRCIGIHKRNTESVWHPPERMNRTLHIMPR